MQCAYRSGVRWGGWEPGKVFTAFANQFYEASDLETINELKGMNCLPGLCLCRSRGHDTLLSSESGSRETPWAARPHPRSVLLQCCA